MSKLDELKEQLAAIQKEIDCLEASKVLPWSYVPDKGDRYCRIYCDEVEEEVRINDELDNGCIKAGNCFETFEQAEKELETRKVIAELRRCEGVKKFETGEDNFGVCVVIEGGIYTVETCCCIGVLGAFAEVYFESEEAAEKAIRTVGSDRIIAAAKWMARGE